MDGRLRDPSGEKEKKKVVRSEPKWFGDTAPLNLQTLHIE